MPRLIDRNILAAALRGPDPPLLVEALGAAYFADAHLPNAVNIPPGQVDRLAPLLIPDATRQLIVYCSETCDGSLIVARRLEELGYSRVLIYRGGKEDWMEHGLPVDRAGTGDITGQAT